MMKQIKSINSIKRNNLCIILLLISSFAISLFIATRYHGLPSQNAYYHIAFSKMITSGYFSDFTIPFSMFSEKFFNQHWLFHLFIAPFIALFGDILGMQIVDAIQITSVIAISYFILKHFKIPFASIFSFGIVFVGTAGFYRYFWGRPDAFVTFFLLLAFYLSLLEKGNRYLWILLSFIFVKFSHTALLIPGIALSYYFFAEKEEQKKLAIRNSFYSFVGILLGFFLSLNPLSEIYYAVVHIFNNVQDNIAIKEWMSLAISFERHYLFIILTIAAFFIIVQLKPTFSPKLKYVLLLSFVSFLITLKARRYEPLFIPCFIFAFLILISQLKNRLLIFRGLAFIFAAISIFNIRNYVMTNERAAAELHINSNLVNWIFESHNQDRIFINYNWSYWSPLTYYSTKIKNVPGYSLFIFKDNPSFFNAYQELRHNYYRLTRSEIINKLGEMGGSSLIISKTEPAAYFFITNEYAKIAYEDHNLYVLDFLKTQHVQEQLELPLHFSQQLQTSISDFLNSKKFDMNSLSSIIESLPTIERLLLERSIFGIKVFNKNHDLIGQSEGLPLEDIADTRLYETIQTAYSDPRFLHVHDKEVSYIRAYLELPTYPVKHLDLNFSPNNDYGVRFISHNTQLTSVLHSDELQPYLQNQESIQQLLLTQVGMDSLNDGNLNVMREWSWIITPHTSYPLNNNVIPNIDLNMASIQESVNQLAKFFVSSTNEKGEMGLLFNPYNNQFENEMKALNQLRMFISYGSACRSARYTSDPQIQKEITQVCKKIFEYELANWKRDWQWDIGILSCLGSFLLEARTTLKTNKADNLIREIYSKVVSQFDYKEKKFKTLNDYFFSGEALVFLISADQHFNTHKGRELAQLSLDYYHQFFLREKSQFVIRWHGDAYLTLKDKLYTPYLTDIMNMAFGNQNQNINESTFGCYNADKSPNSMSGVLFEGLSKLLLIKNNKLNELGLEHFKNQVLNLARCSLNLQIKDYQLPFVPGRQILSGAFPSSLNDLKVRMDIHAHVSNGMMNLLDALKMDFYQGVIQ